MNYRRGSAGWAHAYQWEKDKDEGRISLSEKELRKWWKLNKHTTYNPVKYGYEPRTLTGTMFRSFLYKKYEKPTFALGGK